MNTTRIPKEVLIREWARRDMQVTKGDRVCHILLYQICYLQHLKHFDPLSQDSIRYPVTFHRNKAGGSV